MRLVCALILLFISKSLALPQLVEPCQENDCPAGYYRKKTCGPNNRWNLCKKCKDGYFTAIQNTAPSCIECTICGNTMHMTQQCTSVSDRQCVKKSPPSKLMFTVKGPETTKPPRIVECNPLCKLITTSSHPTTASTTPTTAITTTTTTTTRTTTRISTSATTRGSNVTTAKHDSPAGLDSLVWILALVILLILVLGVWAFLSKNLYKCVHLYCPRWRVKEHTEHTEASLQTDTERGCLQTPTTLDFTMYEKTPVLDVMNPAPPGNPANGAPHLSDMEHRALLDQTQWEPFPAIVMYAVIKEVPLRRWKELMRLLSVADQQLERVELDVGLSSVEKQYQQLRLWSQKPGARMDNIYSALHYMELIGCAQLIRESLDHIQLGSEEGAV